jgi:hypothetical protein
MLIFCQVFFIVVLQLAVGSSGKAVGAVGFNLVEVVVRTQSLPAGQAVCFQSRSQSQSRLSFHETPEVLL